MDDQRALAALESMAECGHGPGLFGLIRDDGELLFAGGVGVADLHNGRSITAEDRFRIGSVTKTYVATLVLMLEADGVVELDAPVARRLPDFDLDPTLTIAHLLQLRSGIPDYVEALVGSPPDMGRAAQVYRRYHAPEDLIALALKQPGLTQPGQQFRYSNTDYLLLGLIVERATGQRLDAQLWQRIFQPLGLRDTEFPAVDPVLHGPHATGYSRLAADVPYLDTTEITPSESWASGAIVSTPGEVATFLDAVVGGQLLPEPQLWTMTDALPVADGRSYGCGLYRIEPPGSRVIFGHQGGTAGFNCLAARADNGRTAVLYQNSFDSTAHLQWNNPFVLAALA